MLSIISFSAILTGTQGGCASFGIANTTQLSCMLPPGGQVETRLGRAIADTKLALKHGRVKQPQPAVHRVGPEHNLRDDWEIEVDADNFVQAVKVLGLSIELYTCCESTPSPTGREA